jgi:hypothetical protein
MDGQMNKKTNARTDEQTEASWEEQTIIVIEWTLVLNKVYDFPTGNTQQTKETQNGIIGWQPHFAHFNH